MKIIRKIISVITLAAFLTTSCYIDDISHASVIPENAKGIYPGSINIESFTLPEYLGQIKDSYQGSSGKTVIHIQDAHCNYACQKRISEIIEHINKEYGVETINLEGGSGEYDLSIFTRIQDREIRDKVADYFVKEGLVNGAEYYAINNPNNANLWGVEDVDLYLENLKVYRDSLKHKERIDEYLQELNHIINNLMGHIFNDELLEIIIKYSGYKEGNLEFKDYLNYLIAKAKSKLIDIKGYPHIFLINQSMKQEKTINFKRANAERSILIDKLKKILSKNDIEELVNKTIKFKSKIFLPKDYYSYLVNKSSLAGINMSEYSELQKFIVYISTYEAVDKAQIMKELVELEDAIKDIIYENEEQKELDQLKKNLILLNNIFEIRISKEDWEYYKDRKSGFEIHQFATFISIHAPRYKINSELSERISCLDKWREDVEKFFECSFDRDQAFLKNMRKGTYGGETSLLISGGFHSDNLCALLRENNISYVSIMPAFRNQEDYTSPYFEILSGQLSGIQAQLHDAIQAQFSTMQIPSMLSALGDEVWGRANIESFKASIVLTRMAINNGWMIDNVSVEKGVEFHTRDGLISDSLSINELLYLTHEEFIDRALKENPEEFVEINNAERETIRRFAMEFSDDNEIIKQLNNLFDNKHIQSHPRLPQDEHAGGYGITIHSNLEGQDAIKAILHGIVAGFVNDHRKIDEVVNALVVENFADAKRLFNNIDLSFKNTDANGDIKALWELDDDERKTIFRDYAQDSASETVPFSFADKIPLEELIPFLEDLDEALPMIITAIKENKSIKHAIDPMLYNTAFVKAETEDLINGQFSQIERAVVELVSNAIDSYSGISDRKRDVNINYEGDRRLTVSDNGKGMDLATILTKLLIPQVSGKETDQGIGRFGIGFYSILNFLSNNGDKVIVETGQGMGETYRIIFSLEDGRIFTQIETLGMNSQGTKVTVDLQVNSIDKITVDRVVNEGFEFNLNSSIYVQESTEKPVKVNDPDRFLKFDCGDVRLGYTDVKAEDKGKVVISVSGVKITSQETSGLNIPETVVIDLPAATDLTIVRNKLKVTGQLIMDLRSFCEGIKNDKNLSDPDKLSLFSAVFPLFKRLQKDNDSLIAGDNLELIVKSNAGEIVKKAVSKGRTILPNLDIFSEKFSNKNMILINPELFLSNIPENSVLSHFKSNRLRIITSEINVLMLDFSFLGREYDDKKILFDKDSRLLFLDANHFTDINDPLHVEEIKTLLKGSVSGLLGNEKNLSEDLIVEKSGMKTTVNLTKGREEAERIFRKTLVMRELGELLFEACRSDIQFIKDTPSGDTEGLTERVIEEVTHTIYETFPDFDFELLSDAVSTLLKNIIEKLDEGNLPVYQVLTLLSKYSDIHNSFIQAHNNIYEKHLSNLNIYGSNSFEDIEDDIFDELSEFIKPSYCSNVFRNNLRNQLTRPVIILGKNWTKICQK